MFELYTERARRSIFFARYEASVFGSPEITSEELLLGVLREDKAIAMRLGMGAMTAIRKEVEQLAPKRQPVATSVDLPLSKESQSALEFAAEEARNLNHKHIHTPHLLLGLLRVEESLAADLLRKHGMTLEQCREIAIQTQPESTRLGIAVTFEPLAPEFVAPQGASLESAIEVLRPLVDNAADRLRGYADDYGDQRLKAGPWTRKEALGHLIDWAIAHQQWVTRAVMESKVRAAEYPGEAAVAVQHYAEFSWPETVDLWASLNRLLLHVLRRVPEDKAGVPCRIGNAAPVSLARLMDAYVEHCADVVAQILARQD